MNMALFILDLNNKSASKAIKYVATVLNVLALINRLHNDYLLPHKSTAEAALSKDTRHGLSLHSEDPL